jgi:hypothetical protein
LHRVRITGLQKQNYFTWAEERAAVQRRDTAPRPALHSSAVRNTSFFMLINSQTVSLREILLSRHCLPHTFLKCYTPDRNIDSPALLVCYSHHMFVCAMFQAAVSEHFARHFPHDVKLVVAYAPGGGRHQLQPQDHRHPLRSGRLQVHGPRPHRRRRHHLHIVARDPHKVSSHKISASRCLNSGAAAFSYCCNNVVLFVAMKFQKLSALMNDNLVHDSCH